MIIPSNTAYSARTASWPATNSRLHRQANSGEAATISDTVTISQATRDLVSSSPATPPGEYPLEYYAMPQWLAALHPVELSGRLGAKADEVYSKGGHLVGTYDKELSEYGERLASHLEALMKREGIDSVPKYHEAMVVDREDSERIRQLLAQSIAGDPRMAGLMAVLGVEFHG